MSRKRSLKPKELQQYAEINEDEWEDFLRDNSDDDVDYELSSEESSTSEDSDQDLVLQKPSVEIEQSAVTPEPQFTSEEDWVDVEDDAPNLDFLVQNVGLQHQGPLTIEFLKTSSSMTESGFVKAQSDNLTKRFPKHHFLQ
ncbi:hypothetical protein RN001_004959 [Aquatica leii]|uniref:Uncharacterized protein n=1 Tax=Aquatica leii TaxID=1421715 RepID=A0AAN7SRY4_9COLE|nr:hypothetical protein RN001_004959 [Aquatica leii]